MKIDIEVKGLDEQIEKLDRFESITSKHLGSAMQSSVITVASAVAPFVPVGVSSRLRGSIFGKVISALGSSVVGKIGSSLREIYAVVQNFGRKEGWFPPVTALYDWVRLKLRVPAKEVPRVAYLVARKISRQGIKGKQFMKKGWEKAKPRVLQIFHRAGDKIMKDLSVD